MKSKKSQTKKFAFNLPTSKKLPAPKASIASKAPVSSKSLFNTLTPLNINILWDDLSNSVLSKIDYAEWVKIQSDS